jgi:peptidoglycan-N-acetylglucosamine deacetylase
MPVPIPNPVGDEKIATLAPAVLARLKSRIPAKAFSSATRNLSTYEIKARDDYEQEKQYRFPKIVRGNAARREVALTFDDGPHPEFTPRILDILKREKVPATFFVVGEQAQLYPALVRREVAEGHEIGNHTYHHVRLSWINASYIEPEIRAANAAIREITGFPTRWFRPPGGDYDPDVVEAAQKANMVMVLWTDDPGDWASPGATTIEQRTLDAIDNGAVILLHDGVPQTLDILPDLIRRVRARGFQFVPLSRLAEGLSLPAPPESTRS